MDEQLRLCLLAGSNVTQHVVSASAEKHHASFGAFQAAAIRG